MPEIDSNETDLRQDDLFEIEANEVPTPELSTITDRYPRIVDNITSRQWQREEMEG